MADFVPCDRLLQKAYCVHNAYGYKNEAYTFTCTSYYLLFYMFLRHIDLQIEVLKDELETAKEAAQRAPSKTMKHLVERLRNQLALKEKQQKVDLKISRLHNNRTTE